MKKRMLAGMLATSLAISVPAQGFSGLGGFLFRKFCADQTGKTAADFTKEYPKLDKTDRLITIGAIGCVAFLGLEWLIKQSTQEKVGFFDLLVGLGGLAGLKMPCVQENIDRGTKWWQTKFGSQDDQFYEDSAEKVSNGVNSIAQGLGSIFGTFKKTADNLSEDAKGVTQNAKNFAKGPQKNSDQKQKSSTQQQQAKPQTQPSTQPQQTKEKTANSESQGGWFKWLGKKTRGVANSFYDGLTSPEEKQVGN